MKKFADNFFNIFRSKKWSTECLKATADDNLASKLGEPVSSSAVLVSFRYESLNWDSFVGN